MRRVESVHTSSSAWPQMSGFMTMPGPPPYGLSSTALCTSCVQSRRSWTPTLIRPLSIAFPSNAARSGARYSGKIVTTSICIEQALWRIHDDTAAANVHSGHDLAHERDQRLAAITDDHEQLATVSVQDPLAR